MSQNVFISFAASDRDQVEIALSKLKQSERSTVNIVSDLNGWTTELKSGEDLRSNIRDRVQSANRVLVFWSKEAATSRNVQYELGMADALDKPITIVQLDQTTPELPAHLLDKVVQFADGAVSV
jgi:TIR domain